MLQDAEMHRVAYALYSAELLLVAFSFVCLFTFCLFVSLHEENLFLFVCVFVYVI
jgi:hypothetical protein